MSLFVLQHENASVAMFDHLVKENDLNQLMTQHGLVLHEDLTFIKELIGGPLDTNAAEAKKVTALCAHVKSVGMNRKHIFPKRWFCFKQ